MNTTLENMTNKTYFTNIKLEAIVTSIKNYFFHHDIVDFVNKLELSDKKSE